MNPQPSASREVNIPVYGTWTARPTSELVDENEEGSTSTNTPGPVPVRPGEYYRFGFGGVADVRDADVEQLAAAVRTVPTFHRLDLSGCGRVTNRGFASLGGLTQLAELKLGCPGLTSDALKTVATMTGMQDLYLEGFSRLTDRGLALLTALPNLKYIGLHSTPITDAALVHLAQIPSLEMIVLNGCHEITDAGLAHLRGHPNLKRIGLMGCWKVGDRGLGYVAELSKLEYVNLSVPGTFWSRVTGRVAMLLGQGRNVPNPKGMYTPAGVKKLLDAHPNCDVDQMFDYSSIE